MRYIGFTNSADILVHTVVCSLHIAAIVHHRTLGDIAIPLLHFAPAIIRADFSSLALAVSYGL